MPFAPATPAFDLPRLRLAVLGGVVAAGVLVSGAAWAGDVPQRQPSPTTADHGPHRALTPAEREALRASRFDERRRAWQELPPEQRSEMWQSLSPEQRELLMRRVPKDERRRLWQQMTPEERDAMRQRFIERREQGSAEGRARLTPEERQRLRDQIRESQRDWKKKPAPENQRGQR